MGFGIARNLCNSLPRLRIGVRLGLGDQLVGRYRNWWTEYQRIKLHVTIINFVLIGFRDGGRSSFRSSVVKCLSRLWERGVKTDVLVPTGLRFQLECTVDQTPKV